MSARLLFIAIALLCVTRPAVAQKPAVQCFSTQESRLKIDEQHLANPFASMRNARERHKGEPLTTRLCQQGDDFLYEIRLLRSDGHIEKLFFDATTGHQRQIHEQE
ncbi:MAG: hypothetical protein EBT19_04630 [Methylocystaceae bacterium]|nr:hypothetical protein [Alphaproteobacteria bacterium]NBT22623.1 hypothetical protein [Methylocystaceae bacterium]NBV94680.1 hypothetical protein [Methylocystaceae bacterium]